MGLFRVRALQRHEVDGFLICFQAAFGIDDQSLSVIRNSLINDPYFHPERVRVGLLDDEIISHVVILHRPAWVGNRTIDVAGITAVATHPYYQRRGYGSRVMRDALSIVRRRGYGLAILTTQVPDFFRRFGFIEVPAVLGYECPATALARLDVPNEYRIDKLNYVEHWPALDAIYREYSDSRTGMQVRDARFWESWPRRGTFPQGFSEDIGAVGLLSLRSNTPVAYLAAQQMADQTNITAAEFAHHNDAPEAMLPLIRHMAEAYIAMSGRRVVLQTGGQAPLLELLVARDVPLELAIGQGLMALVTNRGWIKPCGFRNARDAIQNLFFAQVPVLWHRDGY